MKFWENLRHAVMLTALIGLLVFVYNVSTTIGAEPGTEPVVSVQLPVDAGDLRVSAHQMGIKFEVKGDTIIVGDGKTTLLTIEFGKPTKATVTKDIIPLLESDDPDERLEGLELAEDRYGDTSSGFRLFRRVRRRVSFD